MNKSLLFRRMLPVALALATAWAARGQIGHEYGAAWAAGIGILTMIAVSGRQDWYDRLPVIAALGAIAWGAGGMISYGKVVGFGHAADYLNVSYGLLMLVVIGALYGFIGGGITALALETTPEHKVDWATVFMQMFAGGYLFWGIFIFQLEWLMTPPRSELWAGCMGAALALGWYMYRNGYKNAMRTAIFSALGAGFGFGFGNFLQRMGNTSGIKFNWWNVMEYSIGFFGGLGMAYGIFSGSKWPKTISPDKTSNIVGWVFLIVLLPIINLIEGVNTKTMTNTGTGIQAADPAAFALNWQIIMWVMSALFMILLTYYVKPALLGATSQKKVIGLTLLYLVWYIIISNVISAIWLTPKFVSQHLYWLNLAAVWLLLRKNAGVSIPENETTSGKPWSFTALKWWGMAILVILLVSYIAVSIGKISPNAQLRFE
ncbi:MAG TPA: hypothetical protein VFV68_02360 [Agriterribacter sp.]|nr:hypothetical protein [Agriterribacter sp.]